MEEPIRAADGETRMNQSKRGMEKTSQIFWLQDRGRSWDTGGWSGLGRDCAGEWGGAIRMDKAGRSPDLVKAGMPWPPSSSSRSQNTASRK